MKLLLLSSAAWLFATAAASTEFAVGGNLPDNHILWASRSEDYEQFGQYGAIEKRVPKKATTSSSSTKTTSTSTSTTATNDPNCTNGPDSRACWSNGYSVATDFDAKWPTTGVTRYYTLTISNTTCNPDGGNKGRVCMTINGQYPGPVIRANWGDNLSITVNNNMKHNGTAIHWHGIRQLGTNTMDGVNGITECPLAPGQSKTYTFQATQFGTSWYHSHFSAQYGDGVIGALVIDGPTSSNWDIDLGPTIVNDFYYQTAYQVDDLFLDTLQTESAGPAGSNILINGTNKNVAGTTGKYLGVTLTPGKRHLIRVINTSVDNQIRVSLDGHTLELISSDFVPIKPVTVDSVLIGVGQRYHIIITANQTAGNYWFRAEAESACFSFNAGAGKSIFTYKGVTAANPTTSSSYSNGGECLEPSPLVPWVPNNVGDTSKFLGQVTELDVSFVIPGVNSNTENIVVWGVNASSMNVQWDTPVLSYVMENNNSFPSTENLIVVPNEGVWIYWLIQEVNPQFPLAHPIHLHGHDFYLLGTGAGIFNTSTSPSTLQFTNPTRRDTAMLPAGGWLAIAFPTDNPGAWLLHCHIAWHISEGLGVQFLEDSAGINLPGSQYTNQCSQWDTYAASAVYQKAGSGL